jgi:excisionase family DNA binding protein
MDEYYTVQEAAKKLKMTKDALYKAIQRKQINTVRIGERRVRITGAEIARFNSSRYPDLRVAV